MLAKEYDAMMAAKGTPKVWLVRYAITCPGLVHSELFLTEAEAREFAARKLHHVSVGETLDIWHFTERRTKEAHNESS